MKVPLTLLLRGVRVSFILRLPFIMMSKIPRLELFHPAVKGTLNVLKSCAKFPSVKRVVLTSSIAAVAYNGKPRTPEVVVDESWFSDPDFSRASQLWYVVSKTLAKEAAWKFTKENNIDMVTINPEMVIGPLLQPTLNTTAAAILNIINGGGQLYMWGKIRNTGDDWMYPKPLMDLRFLVLRMPTRRKIWI